MHRPPNARFQFAEVQLACTCIADDLAFFRGLGFELDLIFPADSPEIAVLVGYGLRLRLERTEQASSTLLKLAVHGGEELPPACQAPGGTRIEFVSSEVVEELPALESQLAICRNAGEDAWGTGRAGMQYRDLIADRVGGHFIASHIRIQSGGLVPDYVHYHHVKVQIIYCLKGWVKVVYEDQGDPILLTAGDCFLQPPAIRHRVLECSAGLEVLEIGSPARHETRADRELDLPNGRIDRKRDFSGQVFLWHRAEGAPQSAWHFDGFSARESGLELATNGLARLQAACPNGQPITGQHEQRDAFRFWFVREGSIQMLVDGEPHELGAGDSIVFPRGVTIEPQQCAPETELVEFAMESDRP